MASSCSHYAHLVHFSVGYTRVFPTNESVAKIASVPAILQNSVVRLSDRKIGLDNIKLLAGAKHVHFKNYRVRITADVLRALKGARDIRLQHCEVDDEAVKQLAGIPNIVLSQCYQITDEGITALAGVKSIDLSHNVRITEMGVSALAGVEEIDLSYCEIHDNALAALSGVRSIKLTGCPFITDK
jgi:hypothetical protein